jgi:hypothetical protein
MSTTISARRTDDLAFKADNNDISGSELEQGLQFTVLRFSFVLKMFYKKFWS